MLILNFQYNKQLSVAPAYAQLLHLVTTLPSPNYVQFLLGLICAQIRYDEDIDTITAARLALVYLLIYTKKDRQIAGPNTTDKFPIVYTLFFIVKALLPPLLPEVSVHIHHVVVLLDSIIYCPASFHWHRKVR